MYVSIRNHSCVLLCLWLWFVTVPVVHAQEPAHVPERGDAPALAGRLQPSASGSAGLARQASDAEQAPVFEPAHGVAERRHHTALFITGVFTFGASYMTSAALGALLNDLDAVDLYPGDTCLSCAADRKQYIPLIGPYLALAKFERADFYITAVSQTLGLVLTVLGVVSLMRPAARVKQQSVAPYFSVAATPTPGGGMAMFSLTL